MDDFKSETSNIYWKNNTLLWVYRSKGVYKNKSGGSNMCEAPNFILGAPIGGRGQNLNC